MNQAPRRAVQHNFDPYDQEPRIEALQAVGHPTEKIELPILGGTWNAYRRDYQEWFVKRCLIMKPGRCAIIGWRPDHK